MSTNRTRILTESAIMIALSTVLNFIKFTKLPYGGETTLASMLPVMLVGIMHGPKWGFGTAVVYSFIQLFLSLGEVAAWGLSIQVFIVCILADYLIAYTVLGITGYFRGTRAKAVFGVGLAIFLRFLCHFISGITIWATWADGFRSVMIYSLTYNGAFMLPELFITLVVMIVLVQVPQVRKLMNLK